MTLHEALKHFRKVYGLTQRQAAELSGVAERVWQSYEYGKVIPGADVLISLADHFNISLDYLVGRSDISERR